MPIEFSGFLKKLVVSKALPWGERRTAVVGGGISGSTVAHCLLRSKVVDQDCIQIYYPTTRGFTNRYDYGGFLLRSGAYKLLKSLHIPKLNEIITPLYGIQQFRWDGRPIGTIEFSTAPKKYGIELEDDFIVGGVSYSHFHEVMLNALEKSYPKAMVRGVQALDMEGVNNDEIPTVSLFDPENFTFRQFDLILGCEGQRGKIKDIWFDPPKAKYLGHEILYGFAPLRLDTKVFVESTILQGFGVSRFIQIFPISDEALAWYYIRPTKEVVPPEWDPEPRPPETLKGILSEVSEPFRSLIDLTRKVYRKGHYEYGEEDRYWRFAGRYVTMGEGIHYDLPLFGEGVNQGIHDGARLVNLLTNWEYKNLFDVVLKWEADTKKRHKLVKQKSKWLNKLELVESPFWSDVRDSALKWGGWSGLYNKLYFDLWKAEDDAFKDYQFLKPQRDPTIYYEFATPDKRQRQ